MSYDEKFRRHVLRIREKENLSFEKTAKRFGIGKQTIYNWTKRIEEKKTRNRLPKNLCLKALEEDVIANPDSYQRERAAKFGVSESCIRRALKRLGISYKKNFAPSARRPRKAICLLPKH